MNIMIVGTGYVGLITGVCLSKYNTVYCVDSDKSKIDSLKQGIPTIYENNLKELLSDSLEKGSIIFTTNMKEAVDNTDICFVAVGTPLKDKDIDMSYIHQVYEQLSEVVDKDYIVINKSTVPVGTANKYQEFLNSRIKGHKICVLSNPEFLKEGNAIEDFMNPDRVVIGSEDSYSSSLVTKLYLDFVDENKIVLTDSKSAEMIKYASNSYLATKISLINELANISRVLGANIYDVIRGISLDSRIGNKFLKPGVGYGGSCFPKDVRTLINLATNNNYTCSLLNAVEEVNHKQKRLFIDNIKNFSLDTKITIWGLSFKPDTDDTREAPALQTIKELLSLGYKDIRVYDPKAYVRDLDLLNNDSVVRYNDKYEAVKNSELLIIMTEWKEFIDSDLNTISSFMVGNKTIMDGRNIFINKHIPHSISYYHV